MEPVFWLTVTLPVTVTVPVPPVKVPPVMLRLPPTLSVDPEAGATNVPPAMLRLNVTVRPVETVTVPV